MFHVLLFADTMEQWREMPLDNVSQQIDPVLKALHGIVLSSKLRDLLVRVRSKITEKYGTSAAAESTCNTITALIGTRLICRMSNSFIALYSSLYVIANYWMFR